MTDPIDPGERPRHVEDMEYFVIRDRTIDMTPDGRIHAPPPTSFGTRLLRIAIVVAVVATAAAVAALALWLALILFPIALGAAFVAWALYRFRLWQAGGRFRPPGEWS